MVGACRRRRRSLPFPVDRRRLPAKAITFNTHVLRLPGQTPYICNGFGLLFIVFILYPLNHLIERLKKP